jgi:hypothetical protein
MTGEPSRRSLPGRWLEAIARAIFDEPALSHAVLPTIADFQQEWTDAGTSRRRQWLARWRGYVAFWSLVVMAPVVLRTAAPTVSRPPWSRTRRLGLVLLALVIVGSTLDEAVVGAWLFLLYRDMGGVWRTIGSIAPVAFLAGPASLALVLRRRQTAGLWFASVPFSALMLFGLLSVTVAGLSSGASVAGVFQGISQTGSGGYGVVVPVVSNAALAMRNGLLMALACLVFAGAIGGREWWRQRIVAVSAPELSRRQALAWSALLVAILFGLDQLLRAHHGAMRALTLMADPDPARRSELLQVLPHETLAHSLMLLSTGGLVLTAVVVVAGVKGWRAVRARGPHPLFTWVSRTALILAVLGAAVHARIVVTDLSSFHETIDRLIEHQRANPPRPGA